MWTMPRSQRSQEEVSGLCGHWLRRHRQRDDLPTLAIESGIKVTCDFCTSSRCHRLNAASARTYSIQVMMILPTPFGSSVRAKSARILTFVPTASARVKRVRSTSRGMITWSKWVHLAVTAPGSDCR